MYIIVNSFDNTIYSKWHYMNDKEEHICWKTIDQIKYAHTCRNDMIEVIKFRTRSQAQKFVKEILDNQSDLKIMEVSLLAIESFKSENMGLI